MGQNASFSLLYIKFLFYKLLARFAFYLKNTFPSMYVTQHEEKY